MNFIKETENILELLPTICIQKLFQLAFTVEPMSSKFRGQNGNDLFAHNCVSQQFVLD